MIFEKVSITNLFSYQGRREFDLSGYDDGHNIVIIHGRNGFGKTSFLNSVKLLFAGSNDENMRRVGAIRTGADSRRLTPTQYVYGVGDIWAGICNTQARRRGEQEFSVELEWREGNSLVRAKRSWPPDGGGSSNGDLMIAIDGRASRAEDPEGFLHTRLPRDLIPYFFFDGERIQDLAEASDEGLTAHIERLLDLGRLVGVYEQLQQARDEWRRENSSEELRLEEARLNAQRAELDVRRENKSRQRAEASEAVENLRREAMHLGRQIDQIFENASRFDEEALKREIQGLISELDTLQTTFSEHAPFDAPFIANDALVKTAIERLRVLGTQNAHDELRLARQLEEHLPAVVFDMPPHSQPRITLGQAQFYRSKLIRNLKAMTEPAASGEPSLAAGQERLARMQIQLAAFSVNSAERRAERARTIRRIRELKQQLRRHQDELLEAGGMTRHERERYTRLKEQQANVQTNLGKVEQSAASLTEEIAHIDAEIARNVGDLEATTRKMAEADRTSRKLQEARKLLSLLDEYRYRIRDRRRAAIERLMNIHFRELMSSQRHIARVQLTDTFISHYFDADDNPIARTSISAGAKQLLATALLWALKEVSGRTVPVIIDTPLARIDRRHQDALLQKYYPRVSEQVIVLPTDSELDRDKYKLIKPHIYKEIQLDNPDGTDTNVMERPMYGSRANG